MAESTSKFSVAVRIGTYLLTFSASRLTGGVLLPRGVLYLLCGVGIVLIARPAFCHAAHAAARLLSWMGWPREPF
jgi:hypothetical protein